MNNEAYEAEAGQIAMCSLPVPWSWWIEYDNAIKAAVKEAALSRIVNNFSNESNHESTEACH
jgi:hypothetical protein